MSADDGKAQARVTEARRIMRERMRGTLTEEEFDATPAALEPVYTIVGHPASTPEDLLAALALIAPDSLPTFDTERAVALRHAREQVSAAPMRRFVGQWAVYVAVERHPSRAAALRALESRAATTESPEEARAIASEIGRILDAACTEAGDAPAAKAKRA